MRENENYTREKKREHIKRQELSLLLSSPPHIHTQSHLSTIPQLIKNKNIQKKTVVYNTSIPPNPAMDLLGSQPFPQVTSTMQAVQALLCPMTPDAKEYCVRKVIEKVAGGKDAAGINTITGVQVFFFFFFSLARFA